MLIEKGRNRQVLAQFTRKDTGYVEGASELSEVLAFTHLAGRIRSKKPAGRLALRLQESGAGDLGHGRLMFSNAHQ